MTTRSAEEIRDRIEDIQAREPEDTGGRIPDSEELDKSARIQVLYWALEADGERDVYEKYREYSNTGTTCDTQGARMGLKMRAKMEELAWVLGCDDWAEVEDPVRYFDRLDEVSKELFNLTDVAHRATHEESDTEIERVKDDVSVDPEYIHDTLDEAWRLVGDARSHMLNDDEMLN